MSSDEEGLYWTKLLSCFEKVTELINAHALGDVFAEAEAEATLSRAIPPPWPPCDWNPHPPCPASRLLPPPPPSPHPLRRQPFYPLPPSIHLMSD